jgi:Zn-finger nucleic acid-binding protein
MSKICPKCNVEIDCLDFDVTATCSGSIYKENIQENSWGKTCIESYDSDSLLSNVEFDNFRCPECSEVLFETEEQAIKFMGEKNE